MDGRRCLEEILCIDPDAKVIICSGFSENGPASGVKVDGAKGFVEKPYNMKNLLSAIRNVLDTN
jgi:DNA-binding NarL/FixJ family response regulator